MIIQSISSSNQTKTSHYSCNLKNKNTMQIAFTGFSSIGQKNEIIGLGSSNLDGRMAKFLKETKESLGQFWSRLTGDDTIPTSRKPLTANGEITHPDPFGNSTTKIEVPDKDISEELDGKWDRQGNHYERTGDGTIPLDSDKTTNVWGQAELESKTQQNGDHTNVWAQSEAEASGENHHQALNSSNDNAITHVQNDISSTPLEEHLDDSGIDDFDLS